MLSAHSPSEAVTGCLVGALAALFFVRMAWHAEPGRLSALPVAASLMILAVLMHGVHVPTQRWVTHIALKVSGHDRPFIRAKWRAVRDVRPATAPLSQTLNTLTPPHSSGRLKHAQPIACSATEARAAMCRVMRATE